MISSLLLFIHSFVFAQSCQNSNEFQLPFNSNIQIHPGSQVEFKVPEQFRNRSLSFVILGHRQNPATDKGVVPGTKQDEIPGLTSYQVLNERNEWRYWNGPSSGDNGAKFAEPRYELEMENLYEWREYGHCLIDTEDCTQEDLKPQKIRLVNVGTDPVEVGSLVLKFFPQKIDFAVEKIYSPDTKFNEVIGRKAHFGGGQEFDGLFPQAYVLNGSVLTVDLPQGKKLAYVEIAGGDTHPDRGTNSDGGFGTQGWAKLWIGKGKSVDTAQWFVKNENVPPEGVMMGAPSSCDQAVQAGEKLFIRAQSDTLYIMGYRLSFANK